MRLAEALNCPVLSTYKGKGVVPDRHPRMVGMFTGAVSKFKVIVDADLIVTFGVDPVEFIASPWHHDAPVVEIRTADAPHLLSETAALCTGSNVSNWTPDMFAALRADLRACIEVKSNTHTAQSVAQAIVDAGAHIVSAMAALEADHPLRVLKSSGLSTMGYALQAAFAVDGPALVDVVIDASVYSAQVAALRG